MTETIDAIEAITKAARCVPPDPGVYRGVPFETYKSWDAVNKSLLDHIVERSPLHCRYHMEHPEPETAAMKLGTALHTLVLDGKDSYEAAYAIATRCAGRLAKGGQCRNSGIIEHKGSFFCGTHAPDNAESSGKTILTKEQDVYVRSMRQAVLDDTDARKFIGSQGENELSIVWRDADTGLTCKARIDMLRPTWDSIGDLKTTANAQEDAFSKSLGDYGYGRQAAFYLDGAQAVGIDAKTFGFIAVENEPPHGVGTYECDSATVEIGREQNRKALRAFQMCGNSGTWPGYASGFSKISLPRWRFQRALADQP